MSRVLLDTDILSYYLKGNQKVIDSVSDYLNTNPTLIISSITCYEIMSGHEAKGAKQQLKLFKRFVSENQVLNITEGSIAISAAIYAKLRRSGNVLDDIDILIAGIAIDNQLSLSTNNEKHFGRIEGLKIVNWAK